MKIFGRRKKKSLQERKLTLLQQIKGIESQLNSLKILIILQQIKGIESQLNSMTVRDLNIKSPRALVIFEGGWNATVRENFAHSTTSE